MKVDKVIAAVNRLPFWRTLYNYIRLQLTLSIAAARESSSIQCALLSVRLTTSFMLAIMLFTCSMHYITRYV